MPRVGLLHEKGSNRPHPQQMEGFDIVSERGVLLGCDQVGLLIGVGARIELIKAHMDILIETLTQPHAARLQRSCTATVSVSGVESS